MEQRYVEFDTSLLDKLLRTYGINAFRRFIESNGVPFDRCRRIDFDVEEHDLIITVEFVKRKEAIQ